MELKHRIQLIKIDARNPTSTIRKEKIMTYIVAHNLQNQMDEIRTLIPFTNL